MRVFFSMQKICFYMIHMSSIQEGGRSNNIWGVATIVFLLGSLEEGKNRMWGLCRSSWLPCTIDIPPDSIFSVFLFGRTSVGVGSFFFPIGLGSELGPIWILHGFKPPKIVFTFFLPLKKMYRN